jgi:pimeloyl-ACP methyl ester carboxylesterase
MDQETDRSRLEILLAIQNRDRSCMPGSRLLDSEDRGAMIVESLTLDLNDEEPVPAFFLKPKAGNAPRPTVLYNHSHGGNYRRGKDELLSGAEYLQAEPYGPALARAGFSVLCYDAWCFGDRRGRTETATFKRMLWQGEPLWGHMVFDALRAVDYLALRPDVDPTRIGTLGMSMGGTLAWWLAALEPRIAACVDLCSMTDLHTLDRLGSHDRHDVYYYVPGLLREFSTSRIAALSAPRWHLSLNGQMDDLTPAAGFTEVDGPVRAAYEALGHGERWRLETFPSGHFETTAMRAAALSFLNDHL